MMYVVSLVSLFLILNAFIIPLCDAPPGKPGGFGYAVLI
jgi:hypothetical protein